MQKYNTGDSQVRPPVVMLVYGQGGVGKTTFAATAPKPILADCENGAKYFGLRGIKLDVGLINTWNDIEEFYKEVKDSDYETIIVDPIGELMEKLKNNMIASKQTKLVMRDGTPTMAGWGYIKDKMRMFIKSVRNLGKHMIIVAHVEEKEDEGRIVKRPKIMTKISEELINLVDVVGYMTTIRDGDQNDKRAIFVQPSDTYEAKDRTSQLGPVIEPDFSKIVKACQGTKKFKWSSPEAKGETGADKPEDPKDDKSKTDEKEADKKAQDDKEVDDLQKAAQDKLNKAKK